MNCEWWLSRLPLKQICLVVTVFSVKKKKKRKKKRNWILVNCHSKPLSISLLPVAQGYNTSLVEITSYTYVSTTMHRDKYKNSSFKKK